MRKIIEYTLVSVDGVFGDAQNWGLRNFQDDAYLRDGLGQLLACDAMLMGGTRTRSWRRSTRHGPTRGPPGSMPCEICLLVHAGRTGWDNSAIVRGDVAAEAQSSSSRKGETFSSGATAFSRDPAEAAPDRRARHLDLSRVAGHGKMFFREGHNADLRLVTAKTFSKGIVKLSYEPQR